MTQVMDWKPSEIFRVTNDCFFILYADVDMNFLVFQALNTISTLPFHLIQDTWRWNMFRGDIPVEELNNQYWADK